MELIQGLQENKGLVVPSFGLPQRKILAPARDIAFTKITRKFVGDRGTKFLD